MNKKRLLIGLAVFGVIAVFLILFLQRKPSAPTALIASDTVAQNIRFSRDLEQPDENKLMFFTGSSIAQLDFAKLPGSIDSKKAFDDVAFDGADKISGNSSLAVVRANYSASTTLLDIASDDRFIKSLRTGKNWFIVDGTGKVHLLPVNDQSKVVDAVSDGKSVYLLIHKGGSSQQLVKVATNLTSSAVIVQETTATSFVAADGNTLLVRDYTGTVSYYNGTNLQAIAEKVGEVAYDRQTKKVVMSSVDDHSTSEEGGAITAGEGVKKTLRLYDLATGTTNTISLQAPAFFISRGYILAPSALSQPTNITLVNLTNEDRLTITIDQSQTKVQSLVTSAHIIKDDLSLIALVVNSQLLLLGKNNSASAEATLLKFPIIKQSINEYGYRYSARDNTLIITSPRDIDPKQAVTNSLELFEDSCDCDSNQVAKSWIKLSDAPGL